LRERGYTNSNPSFNAASAGASGQTGGQSAAAAA
jgi:hypothetical protein